MNDLQAYKKLSKDDDYINLRNILVSVSKDNGQYWSKTTDVKILLQNKLVKIINEKDKFTKQQLDRANLPYSYNSKLVRLALTQLGKNFLKRF